MPHPRDSTVSKKAPKTPTAILDLEASDGQDDPAGFDAPDIFAQRYAGAGGGLGDLDADGRTDILWRNTTTGSAVLWQMDGFTKEASASIGGVPLVWEIQ